MPQFFQMSAELPVVLIPARMESTRFPGKPLAPICGVPMVIHCAKNAIASGCPTYICTDSNLIIEVAKQFGINSIQTPVFYTGTDRVRWASNSLGFDNIINLQGDEPLIDTIAIRRMAEVVTKPHNTNNCIFNGLVNLQNEFAFDPNNVKAVLRLDKTIAFLSRKSIRSQTLDSQSLYIKQLGLYAFHKDALAAFASMKQSPLELAENIEMLRWIDNNKILRAVNLETQSISVDTPEDLYEVEKILRKV